MRYDELAILCGDAAKCLAEMEAEAVQYGNTVVTIEARCGVGKLDTILKAAQAITASIDYIHNQ